MFNTLNIVASTLSCRLLSRALKIPEIIRCDKGVQTKFSEKFDYGGSSNNLKSKLSTSVPSDCSGEGQSQNPFRFSPPLDNLKDVFDKCSPNRLRMTPGGSNIITPPSEEILLAKAFTQSPPIPFERLPKSGKNFGENITPPSARALFKDSDDNNSDSLFGGSISKVVMTTPKKNSFVGTPIPAIFSARLQRSGGRVLSYKEPSLKVKVRKGFKFYSFEDEKAA